MDRPARSRWRTVIEAMVLVAVVIGVQAWQTRHLARGRVEGLSGAGLDGEVLSIEQLRGRPALVHFWATWCGVCRAEEGTIASLARDVPMITVASASGDAAAVKEYLRARGVSLPVLVDPDGAIATRFGVGAFPTTLVVSGDGTVRSATVGYTTWIGLKLRLLLAR